MALSLQDLADRASEEALALARTVLEQDLSDRQWAEQLGPALSQRDVARLLDKSAQAVSKDPGLVRLRNRDDRIAYPVFQFAGRRQVPGVGDVVRALADAVSPLMTASWLTGQNASLGDRRPVDVLRDGRVAEVVVVARRFAERMRH